MVLFGREKKSFISVKKKEIPAGVWSKCPECDAPAYTKELETNSNVCVKCGFHMLLVGADRVRLLIDEGTFEEMDAGMVSGDPLQFKGPKTYKEKLAADQKATGLKDAILTGVGKLDGLNVALAVTDSRFIMGSMGSVMGERITRLIEYATEHRYPVVIVSASGGGARMYEGVFSLMQMAKTCAALARHSQAGLLYVSVLTDPTMAGIMASFAGVGDIIMAEPKALIGFTGPRVIEQTIRQKLPEGFQRAEFLLAHGLIDMIVDRKDMKDTLARVMRYAASNGNGKRRKESAANGG